MASIDYLLGLVADAEGMSPEVEINTPVSPDAETMSSEVEIATNHLGEDGDGPASRAGGRHPAGILDPIGMFPACGLEHGGSCALPR
jgi:hypothetical protein